MRKGRSLPALWLLLCLLPGLWGCDNGDGGTFQGYVEADYVYLASSRAGRLERLDAVKGREVAAGAFLFGLEADLERHALAEAEQELRSAGAQLADMESGRRPEEVAMAKAQLEQARAAAANARRQLARNESLARSRSISRKELDYTATALKVADARVTELERQVDVYNLPERSQRIAAQEASVRSIEARVAQARWNLGEKEVAAPVAGLVFDTLYRVGEWVPAGSPVVQLLPPGNVKLRFFVPEAALGTLRIGAQVLVGIDGRDDPLPAAVSYVSPSAEYTPPVIYSNETRSKLVFMVEARPSPEDAASLHPGQPATVVLP